MKLDCSVLEDLLPLYHDGVCSEETRRLVEEHLAQCEKCTGTLAALDGELDLDSGVKNELKPLESISKTVKKGKRKALLTGIAVMLAVVLLLFGGYNVWWYTSVYQFYYQFAQGHDPHMIYEMDNEGNILQSVVYDDSRFTWQDDTYEYRVELPSYLAWQGHVTMERLDNTKEPFYHVQLSVGRDRIYHVSFVWELEGEEGAAGDDINSGMASEYFMVDGELNQYYLDGWSANTIAEQDAVFEEYRDRVEELVNAAKAMWPFLE